MKKTPEEVNKMEPEEYEAYLKTLTPQERAEEDELFKARMAEYNAEVARIKASGVRKFDHKKINKMSEKELTKFLEGLSPEDADLYTKEFLADSGNRIAAFSSTSLGLKILFALIWGGVLFWTVRVFMKAAKGMTIDDTGATVAVIGIIATFVAVMLFFDRLRAKKLQKICKENNFTLIDDSEFKSNYVGVLSREIEIFKEHKKNVNRFGVLDMASLNLRDKTAYIAAVEYSWGSGRYRRSKTAQVLIVESKSPLPYAKIAIKTHFWTGLKFFYLPSRKAETIDINKTYKLFCDAKNAQSFLDTAGGIMPLLEKEKLNIEIGGKYIVVYKFGYTLDFGKFARQTLPVAEAFLKS